ncbi:MAG: dienelactone hydrolase family protein [Alphaproteobacteria bacterium]
MSRTPAHQALLIAPIVFAANLIAPIDLTASTGPPGEMVKFDVDGEKVRAYLSRPNGERSGPGIIVIHEWWGLNGQIRGFADRLAGEGYLAIAPDLYRGKVADDPEHAHELMRALDEDRAVTTIRAAAAYLRREEGTAQRPVGTIGFCMGGSLSLSTALTAPEIQAAVMYYGRIKTGDDAVASLASPLLGLFGEEDRGIPVEEVRRFEAELREAGKTADIHLYPQAGHAFFNETRPSYNREAAADAWERTRNFLRKHLIDAPAADAPAGGAPAPGARGDAPGGGREPDGERGSGGERAPDGRR